MFKQRIPFSGVVFWIVTAFFSTVYSQTPAIPFAADLSGDQEVPPVTTSAIGLGTFTLNPDDTLSYNVAAGDITDPTDAHIHLGAAGTNGAILFPLTPGLVANQWVGTTPPLSDSEKDTLWEQGMYVNVHTSANPGGEVRGQIIPQNIALSARLSGSEMVPPVSTGASGLATFALHSDNSMSYDLCVSGISGTAAHVYVGDEGSNGTLLFSLSGGPTSWTGTSASSLVDQNEAFNSGLYVVVESAAFPNGEIRGQIEPVSSPDPRVLITQGGGSVTIDYTLSGLAPSASVSLYISPGYTDGIIYPQVFGLLRIDPLMAQPVGQATADPTGTVQFSQSLPSGLASFNYGVQAVAFEPGLIGGDFSEIVSIGHGDSPDCDVNGWYHDSAGEYHITITGDAGDQVNVYLKKGNNAPVFIKTITLATTGTHVFVEPLPLEEDWQVCFYCNCHPPTTGCDPALVLGC